MLAVTMSAVTWTGPASATSLRGASLPYSQARASISSQVWRVAKAPVVDGTVAGVSCASGSYCVAVGDRSINSRLAGPFVEVYQHGSWHVAPVPRIDETALLTAVSCGAAASCMAVGQAAGWGYSLRLTAAGWQPLAVPRPAASTGGALLGVSCVRPSSCMTVGFGFNHSPDDQAVADNFDGERWSATAPVQSRWGGQFDAVSCVGPAASPQCTAVGFRFAGDTVFPPKAVGVLAIAEQYTRGRWERSAVPALSGRLQSVSCEPASCLAVGITQVGSTEEAVAASETNGEWAGARLPSEDVGSPLNAVSCPSVARCVAAAGGGVPSRAVILTWEGRWEPPTVPLGSDPAFLRGVSCAGDSPGAPMCVAVGYVGAATSSARRALVLQT